MKKYFLLSLLGYLLCVQLLWGQNMGKQRAYCIKPQNLKTFMSFYRQLPDTIPNPNYYIFNNQSERYKILEDDQLAISPATLKKH